MKKIYCMSFKWMQMPEIKRELQVVGQEAGIKAVTRRFGLCKNRYGECAWNILKNYDNYGFPPVEKLETFLQEGKEVYGCGLKIGHHATEKGSEETPFLGVLEYWKNVSADDYRVKDADIEVYMENVSLSAIPYDVPLTDSHGKEICKVRLWDAKLKEEYDLDKVLQEGWEKIKQIEFPSQITGDLLIPQLNMAGKTQCLRQKYFMVSANVQWAVKKHMEEENNIHNFIEKNEFLLCDEWSGLAALELVRILQKEYGFSKKDAWEAAEQVCVYEPKEPSKNFLELWPEEIISRVLPEIYQILIGK